MGFFKHKLGLFVLILCLGIVVAAIWYFLFGIVGGNPSSDGTLVRGIDMARMMIWV